MGWKVISPSKETGIPLRIIRNGNWEGHAHLSLAVPKYLQILLVRVFVINFQVFVHISEDNILLLSVTLEAAQIQVSELNT